MNQELSAEQQQSLRGIMQFERFWTKSWRKDFVPLNQMRARLGLPVTTPEEIGEFFKDEIAEAVERQKGERLT